MAWRDRLRLPPAILLDIDLTTTDGRAELRVAGEVDLATVPELRAALDDVARTPGPLRLDLSGVGFMDSTGLQLLLVLHRERQAPGLEWTLVPSDAVLRVCEVSGVAGRLPLEPRP